MADTVELLESGKRECLWQAALANDGRESRAPAETKENNIMKQRMTTRTQRFERMLKEWTVEMVSNRGGKPLKLLYTRAVDHDAQCPARL